MNRTAGGVVVGQDGRVIVVNQNGDSWSLPKGHLEAGEDQKTAATREIAEESGITQLEFVAKLGEYERYTIGKNGQGEDRARPKHITMFLFSTTQKQLAPADPDNPNAQWVAIEHVAEMLTHPKDAAFFKSVKARVTDFAEKP